MRKVIQTSQKQTSDSEEEKLMFLQEVFLVNPFPLQAKEKERMITVTSGLTCSGPYMKSGLIGSLVKMLLVSSRWYSPVRRLKWEANPLYSERVHKWKQPHAPSPHSQLNGEKQPDGLSDFLDFYGMLLPTPVASDAGVWAVMGKNDGIIVTPKGKIRKINQKGHVWSVGLGRMAELLPTPTARDWKGAASLESLEKRGRIPEKNSLPDFFARTGKSFQLNPLFVAEMMGFPPGWTVSPFLSEEKSPLKDTETPSSPR